MTDACCATERRSVESHGLYAAKPEMSFVEIVGPIARMTP